MACTGPQYGGFEQTLFLGCSIKSFSSTAGSNEQATELTVELVEDPCGTPSGEYKYYYNASLVKSQWTDPDPGFIGEQLPIIGCPCYFRFMDFEFSGLIQSWERVETNDGNRYVVKIVSPVQVLQDTSFIINNYAGAIKPTSYTYPSATYLASNIFNVYGYAQAFGYYCPQYYQSIPGFYELGDGGNDGSIFGTPGGGFGPGNAGQGSLVDNNGMPWYQLRGLMSLLTSAYPSISNVYTAGRLLHKGVNFGGRSPPWTNGFGLIQRDLPPNNGIVDTDQGISQYILDLQELPILYTDYRFNQDSLSALEIISRVCKDGGLDFYVELLPVNFAGGIVKVIKIRTISRISSPVFGEIDNFINAAEASGILRGSSSGREFRNELTSKFVVGGKKQTLYQAYQSYDPAGDGPPTYPEDDDMIIPYFGSDESGVVYPTYLDSSGNWEIQLPSAGLEASLTYASFSGNPVTINENELRASSDFKSWSSYIIERNTVTHQALEGIRNAISIPTFQDLYHWESRFRLPNGKIFAIVQNPSYEAAARDFNSLRKFGQGIVDEIEVGIEDDSRKIHSFVSNIATEYYGRKFAVRVPYTCVYKDPSSLQLIYSEQPAPDGGWTEMPTVMGLPKDSDELTFFRNESNKIETIIAYTGAPDLDLSVLNHDSYILYSDDVYIKSSVEPEYVFHTYPSGIPRAVVEIPSVITTGAVPVSAVVHGLVDLYQISNTGDWSEIPATQMIDRAYENVGGKGSATNIYPKMFLPDAVAFGIRSTVDTYGPWASLGPPGGIVVEHDEGLVPWEYGGYTNMNTAGYTLAQEGLANMQVGEMGTVSVVGYPDTPLGSELNSAAAYGGKQLLENRNTLTTQPFNSLNYVIYDFGFSQQGIYGPVISSLTVSVGDEVTTQYNMRTYTPKFGKFARINAERLKEVAQNRMKYVRDLNLALKKQEGARTQGSLDRKSDLFGGIDKIKNPLRNIAREWELGTPHELFVGQLIPWGEGKRTLLSTSSVVELPTEFHTGTYEGKSIASFDSLIRPISIKGAGGLPRFIPPTIAESGTPTGADGSRWPISQIDLNPYVNPISLEPSGMLARRYDTGQYGGAIGHDIDIVSRKNPGETGLPDNGLSMQNTGLGYDYKDDYRTMALRGPLVIQSWGFDNNGNPIPNYVDNVSDTATGNFAATGLSGTFMSGWLHNPQSWPVAPVDLRLDRNRGVWVAGGNTTIIRGFATNASSDSGTLVGINNVSFFQGSDAAVTGVEAVVSGVNEFDWSISSGNLVYGMLYPSTHPSGNNIYAIWQTSC